MIFCSTFHNGKFWTEIVSLLLITKAAPQLYQTLQRKSIDVEKITHRKIIKILTKNMGQTFCSWTRVEKMPHRRRRFKSFAVLNSPYLFVEVIITNHFGVFAWSDYVFFKLALIKHFQNQTQMECAVCIWSKTVLTRIDDDE